MSRLRLRLFASCLALGLLSQPAVAAPPGQSQAPPNEPGFPMVLAGEGSSYFAQPTLADLKISGQVAGSLSIVFGTTRGKVHVLYKRASTGTWVEAPGFPKDVMVTPCTAPQNTCLFSGPAVGDLNSDGVPEIVLGYGDQNLTVAGGVVALSNAGSILWRRPSADQNVDGRPDSVLGSPAIGDVDGDGKAEVAWGATDHRIYLVDGASGANETGSWPLYVGDTVWSSPALHDLDGDGRLEIIIGSDAQQNPYLNTTKGGLLHVFRWNATQACHVGYCDPATEYQGFPKQLDQVVFSSPVVGDIDGDGRPEIVHGTGGYWPDGAQSTLPRYGQKLYSWECDGTATPGWPVTIKGVVDRSPALADLTGDGIPEVMASADNSVATPAGTSKYYVYAVRGNGSILFEKAPISWDGYTNGIAPPVVADVLGNDSTPEILVPTTSSIAVFSNTGTLLTGTQPFVSTDGVDFAVATVVGNVAVADLDPGDGQVEVVGISAEPYPGAANAEVYVWNPVNRATAPLWGQYRGTAARTGVRAGTPACRSYGTCPALVAAPRFYGLTPCRLVDTRGTGAPIGGPAMTSGAYRDLAIRGKCGVPSTAKAVSVNITLVSPTGSGFVGFSPSCQLPLASSLNFSAGQTRANNAILAVGEADGILTASAYVDPGAGSVHIILDVNGYFAP